MKSLLKFCQTTGYTFRKSNQDTGIRLKRLIEQNSAVSLRHYSLAYFMKLHVLLFRYVYRAMLAQSAVMRQ